jgi:hypothetical protein
MLSYSFSRWRILLLCGCLCRILRTPGDASSGMIMLGGARASDTSYDDFVQEVIEEDAWRHEEDEYEDEDFIYEEEEPPTPEESYEERLRRKRDEDRLKAQAEEERRQRQEAEEAFNQELDRLAPEQQKLMKQKRRKDGKIVQRVLSAWQRQDYYAVLGIRRFFPEGITLIRGRSRGGAANDDTVESTSPPFYKIWDIVLRRTWPTWTVLRVRTRAIQQAYRSRAVQVHPDKNRDPRTSQAFVAVQDAVSILSDPKLRKEYEEERRQHRQAVRQAWKDRYHRIVHTTLRPVWKVTHKIVGPMTVPIVVIGALVF